VTTSPETDFRRLPLPRHPIGCVVAAVVGIFCCSVCLPVFFPPLPADCDASVPSAASLRSINNAILAYADTYGRLPPAVVTDDNGRPLYSWRVLILPFLSGRQPFEQFKLDEAWDSPNNRTLLATTPDCYLPFFGGRDPPGTTRYQVFVGPGTPFDGSRVQADPASFPDGMSNTFLVVEGAEPVPWSKPADLVFAPDQPLPSLRCEFTKPVTLGGFLIGNKTGFNAYFADRSWRFISSDSDPATLRALVTRNGGEPVDWSKLR
jgi:hypothetical protein